MNIGVSRSMVGDDDVLFEPSSWHIKIDFINQFILNNNVLISVLGEKGAGKTTFAQLLKDTVTPNLQVVMLTATPLFESLPFVEQMCFQLDLDVKSSFSELVNEINARQSRTLIIIDNAEELPDAFLTEILAALTQQEGSGYCHVCIVSDFSLVKMTSRLAREAYRDMIHSIELQPLNEAETKAYVLMRMAALDANKVELSDDWLQQFYELTDGNIMGINTQMMGFFADKSARPLPFYQRYLSYGAIPVFVLAAVGGVYFISSQAPSDAPQLAELVKSSMESVELELPLMSEIPFYEVASVHQPVQMVSLQKIDIQMANEADNNREDGSLVVMDKVVPIPKIQPKQPVEIARVERSIDKVVAVEKATPHQSTDKKASKKLPVVKQAKPAHTPLKTTAASSQFTIQLMATRDKGELGRLTKQYRAEDGFKIRRFENQGIAWYVLTHGDFSQKERAQQALKTLPKNLAQLKPWVRSTSNLKNMG